MAQKPFSVEVTDTSAKGEGRIRRNRDSATGDLLSKPRENVSTVYELLQYSIDKFGDKDCMGHRNVVKEHTEEKMLTRMVDGEERQIPKKWTFWELSPYIYRSFKEVGEESAALGSGLRNLGLNPGDRIELYAGTSANWQLMAQGAVSQSIPIVTAYDTLGEEGLTHSLQETNATAIFLDGHLIKSIVKPLSKTKDVKYVIYKDEVPQEDIDALKAAHGHLIITTYDELLESGKKNPHKPTPPKPSDLACIMYTSGTTGPPKGVVITHTNIIAAVSGVDKALGKTNYPNGGIDHNDFLLCFLPLAHILEFVYELCGILWGGTIGYATVKTLTEASTRNCKGDIKEFRPTILVGIPAVWESIRKGIIGRVQGTGLKEKIFWGAFSAKSFLQRWHLPGAGILNAIVFNKIKEATGGRVRLSLSGGAPLASETQHFMTVCVAILLQGYGLTETCAMCAIMTPDSFDYGSVGVPMACAEVKLVDVADAGYFANNKPSQGEIWLRGPSITKGYYNRDKETEESFTEDGWFKTGDIGQWEPSGTIKIIDRKKNLVKTLNGEYIALEKLESLYRTCNLVQNILVYADQQKSKPVAIVLPAEPALKAFAEKKGLGHKDDDLEDLVHNRKLEQAVHQELLAAGKRGGLGGIELIAGVVLVPEEWTPQNGLVTAAQKLNRKAILAKHQKEVDKIYERSG